MVKSYIKFTDEDINFKAKIFSNNHESWPKTHLVRLMEQKLNIRNSRIYIQSLPQIIWKTSTRS